MEMKQVWNILSIKETKDEAAVKEAYRQKLVEYNPEDDPEGFKRLREAYEMAVRYINEPEEAEEKEKDEVDLWIDRALEKYTNIYKRTDEKEWKDLFAEDVCMALDTANEAREKFIVFLLDHYNFPQNIYRVIDNEFQIVASKNELMEKFPKDFLDYFEYQVNHETFMNYSLFETEGLDESDSDIDSYINTYFEIRRLFDEQKYDEAKARMKDARDYLVYHPYMDVEKMRILNMTDTSEDKADTFKLCGELLEKYGNERYVEYMCAAVLYDNEKYEEAMEHFERLLADDSDHYGAKLHKSKYALYKKDFKQAKELVLDLIEKYPQDNSLVELMREINDSLMKELKSLYDESGLVKDALEYAWCTFQNEAYEDTIKFLDTLTPEGEDEYDYTNLYGRCLFANQEYEKALPYVLKWKEMIFSAVPDDSEKYQKKLRRRGFSLGIVAMCYAYTKQYNESIPYFEQAIEYEDSMENRLSYMERLSNTYNEMGEYEKAVEVCDKIIDIDERYYPAYLNRQEAYFNMKYGQEVINDYYNATAIFPGYYKPYLYAAKVFFYFRQYDNSIEIIEAAKEKASVTNQMRILEIKIHRIKAENNEQRHEVIKEIAQLRKLYAEPDNDIENLAEIDYEECLVYYDAAEYDKAMEFVKKAIEKCPDDYGYRWTMADTYYCERNYEDALKVYLEVEKHMPDNADVHYDLGNVYEKLGNAKNAEAQYLKVLDINPEHNDANNKLMNIYQNYYTNSNDEEWYKKALEHADRQIENNPGAYYYVDRGLLYMEAAKYEEAIQDYETALTYNPEDMFAYNNSGYALKVLGRYDEAVEKLLKSIELMKAQKIRNRLPYSNLADCYEIMGEYEKAIAMYEENIKMLSENNSDSYTLYDDMADLYLKLGRYEDALKTYERARKRGKATNEEIALDTIRIYVRMNKKLAAMFRLNKVSMSEPNRKDAFDIFLQAGNRWMYTFRDYKKAYACYEKAFKRTPKYTRNYIEVLRVMARVNCMFGKKELAAKQAEEALDTIIRLWGSIENYKNFAQVGPMRAGKLGELYLYKGDIDTAKTYFDSMSNMLRCKHCSNKCCYDKYLNLGVMYELTEDYDMAYEMYRKANELDPFDDEAISGLEAMEKIKKKRK